MTSYVFILGRTPKLAFVELQTFFPDIELVASDVVKSSTELPMPADVVLSKLGGTVKIADTLGTIQEVSAQSLLPFFDTTHGRFSFGISTYGEATAISRTLLEEVKNRIEEKGVSVRFVEAKRGGPISSVVVAKDHLQELILVRTNTHYIVGRTIAVQPFEDWGERDFGRPHADPKKGMLPPKVSRMVVNIADRKRDLTASLAQKTLLDPFCGMGTILGEALVMGWNVVGTDQSSEVLDKCRANLRWLTEKRLCAEGVTYRLQSTDAVHVSDVLDKGSIDAIVTEPYMGDTNIKNQISNIKNEVIKNRIKGLEKLYIGCLRDWQQVLKPQGMVMMALPLYELGGKTYFVKKVIDMCETLGYTIVTGPIEYSRPQAVVSRAFYLFQKK